LSIESWVEVIRFKKIVNKQQSITFLLCLVYSFI
jgi:hypothetical protein